MIAKATRGVRSRTVVIALGVMVAVLVGIASMLLPVRNAGAAFPGRNGLIAFDAVYGLDRQILVMEPDGTHQQVLTRDYRFHFDPTVSPNGRRVAFVTKMESGYTQIHSVRVDGTRERALTFISAHDDEPAYSPNGKRIIFRRRPGKGAHIYVMRADGSGQRELRHGGQNPSYWPNGKRILFQRDPKSG